MKRGLLWLFAFLCAPALLLGQAQTTGTISGKVMDEAGQPVSGVEVVATAEALSLERKDETGADGEFRLSVLPVGSYSVLVSKSGFQPAVYSLNLSLGENVPLDVTLSPGEAVTDTVNVYGTASALETTSGGENFSYEREIDTLPVNDRRIDKVAELSPNIAHGPTTDTVSIAGAPSFDTVVLLDGAEVSDPYFGSSPTLYLEDAVEEVQVLTSGVSARYGRFQGGVINAITKSGTNTYKGTLRAELDKESWNSTTPFNEDQDDNLNKAYQATLGGFLVKDRLWFFAGGRKIPTTSASHTTEFTGESFTSSSDETRWQGKLKGAITESHLIDLSHLDFDSSTDNYEGLPAGDGRALGTRLDPRTTDTLGYQGVFTANTFADFQATRKRVSISAGGDASKGDPFLDLTNFQVFHNHWWDVNDPGLRDNDTAALSLTHLINGGRYGAHTIEGGVQYVKSLTGGENRQTSTKFNLLAFNPDFVAGTVNGEPRFNLLFANALRWEALPLGGDQTLKNTAVYLQDTINLSKFRFDVGVRYDKYKGAGPLAQFNLEFSDVSPRLGVTYSLTDTWQVQATYGKYSSRFNDSVANSVTGVAAAPRIETFYLGPDLINATADEVQAALRNDANWPFVTGFISPQFPTTYLANDIEAPYAEDINLSVRHALPGNTGSVVFTYVNRQYKNLLDDFVGGVCDFGFSFDQPCPSGNTTTVPGPDGTPNFATVDSIVWANNNFAKRKYQALTAVWNYRPNSKLQFVGNYTYSRLRGNYEGEGENTPASGSPIGNYARSTDIGAANPNGTLAEDIPHRLNALATYRFDWERRGALTLGGALLYESGAAYSRVASVPYAEDPAYLGEGGGFYNHYFSRRGAFRFDDWWSLGTSFRYDLPLVKDFRTFVKLSIANVTNNHALVEFQTTGQSGRDAAGNVIPWQPVGNCGPGDKPSRNCTGYGRITSEDDYQRPREFLVTVAFDF
ncbi:MAG TPA: TonB-dependent receptor [Thermoanaerobaculia bacterium]|nr:TonB-dependent receptor [Thermoanaerobaculia bacterium]